jgi:hypothetical protein
MTGVLAFSMFAVAGDRGHYIFAIHRNRNFRTSLKIPFANFTFESKDDRDEDSDEN